MSALSSYEAYQPTTYPWNVILCIVGSFSNFIAFVTPYWLANDHEMENAPFLNLGLWQVCFQNYRDFRYLYDRVYDGCYWTLEEEMHVIEDQMRRPFYVSVQTLFTFCFVLSIISTALGAVQLLCPGEDSEKGIHKLSFIVLLSSFSFGFIAVIIFAVLGDARDWMPMWDHNFLSWSFALAVVGVVLQFVSAALFWVEYRITKRGEQFRNTHGMFVLDPKA